MRLLFDENISYRIIKKIVDYYPDSESSVRLKLIGHEDTTIWQKAKAVGYDIVTFDEDYVHLSQLHGAPPKVIFIRPGNIPTQPLAELLIRNHEMIHAFLTSQTDERDCLELIDFTRF